MIKLAGTLPLYSRLEQRLLLRDRCGLCGTLALSLCIGHT